MAIIPESQFEGKISPSDGEYPYGKARNVTTQGDGTGTPWVAALVNDIFGFQQALLTAADIIPSNTPDRVGASQYLESLRTLFPSFAPSVVNVAGADDVPLTDTQARSQVITLGGDITADIAVIVPDAARSYVVINETTGDFTVTLKTDLGSGVELPRTGVIALSSDGEDVRAPNNAGYLKRQVDIPLDGADVPLSEPQAVADIINLTGGLSADVSVIVPDDPRLYTVVNSTSGSFTVTVKTADGSGVVVEPDSDTVLRCDGTDVVRSISGFSQDFSNNGYQIFPSGLIIQWLRGSGGAGGLELDTLPIAFPNAFLFGAAVDAGGNTTASVAGAWDYVQSNLTTFASYWSGNPSDYALFAIGY